MNIKINKVYTILDKFEWFSDHAGYDLLSLYLKDYCNQAVEFKALPNGFIKRSLGKFYSIIMRYPKTNSNISADELLVYLLQLFRKNAIYHILYFELHRNFFKNWHKAPANIVCTLHHPAVYHQQNDTALKNVSSAIVLYQRDMQFFQSYVGEGRVKFVHLGVDTSFFKPSLHEASPNKHILFVGRFGRNFEMLARLVKRLSQKYSDISFDFVIPKKEEFLFEGLKDLIDNTRITWHDNISAIALRRLYQDSYLLFIPMCWSGANNTVVEALACGLPIVTTDVGGIRDYGGGSIYPVVENDADEDMFDLLEQYLVNLSWRNQVAGQCRQFAEQYLAWPIVAQKHIEAYQQLTGLSLSVKRKKEY